MIKNRARVRERMKHKERRGECKNYKEKGGEDVKLI